MKMETKSVCDSMFDQHENYQPESEYFMVDFWDGENSCHTRLPFLTQDQMLKVCIYIKILIERGSDIRNFRVLPEKFLDESLCNPEFVQRCASAGVEDYKCLELTHRAWFFDWRYEENAQEFKKNDPKISRSVSI